MPFLLNLADKPYLNRRSLRLWLVLTGGALLLLLFLNLVYGYQNYRQYQQVGSHLDELDNRLADRHNGSGVPVTAEVLEAASRQIAMAEEIVTADRFRWTLLLGRLEELAPAGVAIRSIRPDFRQRSLQLTAVARDLRDMTAFLDALLASPDLAKVYLSRHADAEESASLGRSQMLTRFSLTIEEAF